MQLIIGTPNIQPLPQRPVLAIGNFDGLHRGHQAILARTVAQARKIGVPAAVLTFEPHPARVLAPEREFKLLDTFQEKVRRIESVGIEVAFVAEFDPPFAAQSPETFVQRFLCEKIACSAVVVGENYRFGKGREGKVADLVRLGASLDFEVFEEPPVFMEGEVVSSSKIRALIQEGAVSLAGKMMGRFYTLRGKVVPGDGMGTRLGFPTANLRLPQEVIPKTGIYAVKADILNAEGILSREGVAYIGQRPTFGEKPVRLEVHLFEWQETLYDKRLVVSFIDRIRDDQKFDNETALILQMEQDAVQAREILSTAL
jgi:riboflavin kinase/FMN adenylyltransferase